MLACEDDVNLTGDDIRTIERNADVLLNACKDIGLAVNTGKTKYMELGRYRGMMAIEHITVGSNRLSYLILSYILLYIINSEAKILDPFLRKIRGLRSMKFG